MTPFSRDMTILTERLALRPLRLEDAEAVVAWRNEPHNAELFLAPPPTLEQHLTWFASPRPNRLDYVITIRANDDVVGTLNYVTGYEEGQAETGTLLGAVQYRGQGIATEAKLAWTLFGFAVLDIDTIVVRVREDNVQMLHIDKKLGYEQVGKVELTNALGAPHMYCVLHLRRRTVLQVPAYQEADNHGFLEAIRARDAAAG